MTTRAERMQKIDELLAPMRESISRHSKYVTGLAAILWLISCLCPPWVYTHDGGTRPTVMQPAGYHFLFAPPPADLTYAKSPRLHGVAIDFDRLGLEWVAIFLAGVALVLLRK